MHNMHDKQFIHFYVAKSALLCSLCTQFCSALSLPLQLSFAKCTSSRWRSGGATEEAELRAAAASGPPLPRLPAHRICPCAAY